MTTRKKRSDRNHIIYKVVSKITGKSYIGLTERKGQKLIGSVKIRWKQHLSKARRGFKVKLYDEIRECGEENFDLYVVEIVRGRKEAFAREAYLINKLEPELNTRIRS